MAYALKVPLLGLDSDWIFVTERKSANFEVVCYSSYDEALKASKIWKRSKIVSYEPRGCPANVE